MKIKQYILATITLICLVVLSGTDENVATEIIVKGIAIALMIPSVLIMRKELRDDRQ